MPATLQTMPNTIAAMKPNDRTAASTFSRIVSSIVASITAALAGDSCSVRTGGRAPVREVRSPFAALPS